MCNKQRLADAFAALEALPPPSWPDNEELAEWLADLIEMDAFYAGIASTVLNHGRVEHFLQELDTLAETLMSIRPRTELDKRSLEECRAYLEQLQEVREALLDGG